METQKRCIWDGFLLLFLIVGLNIWPIYLDAQSVRLLDESCGCTVEQVKSNTVVPCDLLLGAIDTVGSVSELWDAINLANSSGGNATILIEDGTYPVASTAAFPYITADNVVFRSLSGNRDAVILEGQGMVPRSSTENGFLIAGNNVTIADLTIRNVANHGIQVSGHKLFVHNVKILDTYEQIIKGSTSAASIDSAIVQCSLLEYTAGVGPNWYIGGLDIHKGKGWIVRDNLIRNVASPGSSVAEHAIHFWDNSLGNLVERNMIYNCDRGIGFGLGNSGLQNDGGIIRNNMIYNDGLSLFHDVGIGLESSPNTRVYNNTVMVEYPNAIEYRFASTNNVDIANNLCNKAITSRDGGVASLATNLTDAEASWFVDVTTGDLHLAGTGYPVTVVDMGTDLGAYVEDDIDQVARPMGLGYEIGAQEVTVSTSLDDLSSAANPIFELVVYPSPAASHVVFDFERAGPFQLKIMDPLGKVVYASASVLVDGKIEIGLADWPTGIYFYKVDFYGSVKSGSFLKE